MLECTGNSYENIEKRLEMASEKKKKETKKPDIIHFNELSYIIADKMVGCL